MTIKNSVLDEISDVLNGDVNLNSLEFYDNFLNKLYGETEFKAGAVYFLDNISLVKKGSRADFILDFDAVFDEKKVPDLFKFFNLKGISTIPASYKEISSFLASSAGEILKDKFFIFSKLSIKTSFFGFIFLILDKKPDKDLISIVNLFVSVYSYLIKDFELNSVFKTQLNLLQEAISDKEKALKIIEKQNKKLKEEDTAKTSFLANVSHELRTPLNAIIGFSDALRNKLFGPLTEKQSEYIGDINNSAVHLLGLINEILDFSKIESGSVKLNMVKFDPNLAIKDVISLMSSLSGAKNIEIETKNLCNKQFLYADYQKFQQILFNLLGNALKFSPENSKITVVTKDVDKKFILEVHDSGIGIDKKYHKFIFKKFTQINNIYTKQNTSTGLGLAITKEYAALHKGKVYVISEAGHGSTFVVELNNTSN